jgi:hypothetical protein
LGRFDADNIEVGKKSIAETWADAFSDLTVESESGMVGLVLARPGLAFSTFQARIKPVSRTDFGEAHWAEK